MPSQREYKSFPKQIWSFCFSSFTDCRKIYKYNIGLSIYLKFSYFTNKSYFYHFIVINFAKPSWRSLRTMISSVTNPTDFVDWFETLHKMWSCSFWIQPRRGSSLKDQPPRNTPDSFCRRFTRQNPSLCCMGGIFLLRETHLENLMSRPNVIPTFRQRRCINRGWNFVRCERRLSYTSSDPLLIFAS